MVADPRLPVERRDYIGRGYIGGTKVTMDENLNAARRREPYNAICYLIVALALEARRCATRARARGA